MAVYETKDRRQLMKIVCAACGTRYQIDDRKVTGSGRVFRISCRSCRSTILVDGLEGRGAGPSGWFLDDSGRRQGPMELDELRRKLGEHPPSDSALIWSNGLDKWHPVSALDRLVAPWEAETMQGDVPEEEDPTTLISLDEIARVHAEIEARDAPILNDDEVELIEESQPPSLPSAALDASLVETIQRIPEAEEAIGIQEAETAQEGDEERQDEPEEEGEVAQTLIFKLDPSSLGADPILPEASEVIASSDTGEDLHEVGGSAAALFRLDDLALGNEAKSATSIEQGGVGLSSSSLFVGDHARPTDPAAVSARPRTEGTVTTNVPMVKKRGPAGLGMVLGAVGFVVGVGLTIFYLSGDSNDGETSPAPQGTSAAVAEGQAASKPAEADPVSPAPKTPEPAPVAKADPTPSPTPEPAVAEAAAPATPAAAPEPQEAKGEPAPTSTVKPEKKAPSRASSSGKKAERRAPRKRDRGDRDVMRDEPVPNFGRAAKSSSSSRSRAAATKKQDSQGSGSVNALLGQLKNKPAAGGASGEEQLPQKLSASEVRGTLRKRQSRFKDCYRRMENRPEGAVTVKTSFKIAPTGRVSTASIVSAGGVTGSVQSCILEAVRSAKFPRFRGPEMIVNYPILLR